MELTVLDYDIELTAHSEPFAHYRGTGLLSADRLRELAAAAPEPHRFERLDRSTGDVRRRYRLSAYSLLDESEGTVPPYDELSAPWRELVADLLSDRFGRWLRGETGFEPRGAPRTSAVFAQTDGDFQDLSTGKLDKAMHFSLYLNQAWPKDGGGEIQLWPGPDRDTGAPIAIAPIGGTCFLYAASPSTWHLTAPVAPDRGLVRTWISLSYFQAPLTSSPRTGRTPTARSRVRWSPSA